MGLSLRGSTSGSIDINPPAVAGNNTITLPGDNGSANQFFRNSTIAGIVTYSSMVEDSSGNIGIGLTNPSAKLEVYLGTNISGTIARFGGYNDGRSLVFSNSGIGNDHFINAQGGGGSITFQTSSVDRVRIDSDGRLGVGVTSWYTVPDANYANGWSQGQQIKITDASNAYGGLAVISSSSTVNQRTADLALCRQNSSADYAALENGSRIGAVTFNGADGTKFVRAALIRTEVDGAPGTDDMPGRLLFATTGVGSSSPTERMRIDRDGVTRTFSSSTCFAPCMASSAGTNDALIQGRHSATDISSGTTSFLVWSNGDVANTNDTYGAISDIKLKENIVDAGSQWDDFKAVRFRKYNFKEETGHETFTQLGVIAQELELVSPGLVTETPDVDEQGNDLGTTTKSVKYSILTKKALVALQEAMERIEQLEAKVAAMENA